MEAKHWLGGRNTSRYFAEIDKYCEQSPTAKDLVNLNLDETPIARALEHFGTQSKMF